jgi:hypothetical protein
MKSVKLCNPSFGEEVLGYMQEGLVTLRMNLNVHLEVTTPQNVLLSSDKTKKFTHCRFLVKHFDPFFMYCIRTYEFVTFQKNVCKKYEDDSFLIYRSK